MELEPNRWLRSKAELPAPSTLVHQQEELPFQPGRWLRRTRARVPSIPLVQVERKMPAGLLDWMKDRDGVLNGIWDLHKAAYSGSGEFLWLSDQNNRMYYDMGRDMSRRPS